MKKTILIIIGFLVQLSVIAQINSNKDFVYFFNDSIKYGEVEFKSPFVGTDYILLNSEKISIDHIKFYKNITGFHANTKNVNFWGTPAFSECISKGKINLFEKVNVNHSMGHWTTSGMYVGGGSSKTILNYYNKGFGDLKKANYVNLSLDLADNPESMKHLEKFRKLRNTQTGFYLASGAAVLVGFVTLVNKTSGVDYDTEPSPNVTAELVTIGVGAVCGIVGYTISFSKPEHLRRAVNVYNR